MNISKKFALSLLEDWQKAGQKSYLRRDHVSCSMYISKLRLALSQSYHSTQLTLSVSLL